ncbi:MAG: c-type cytochrome [Myxococcota bacterium]
MLGDGRRWAWGLLLGAVTVGCGGGTGAGEDLGPPVPPGPIVGGDGPGEPPADAVRGILECPTVPRPEYTLGVEVEVPLSTRFTTNCASCHGATGEGRPGYPALSSDLSFDDYLTAVREGPGAMPRFDASVVSDETLRNDYELLRDMAEGAPKTRSLGDEWTWSDAQVEEAYARGLTAWRKPDPLGVACANCHTPDAVDLAVLGYEDHDIMRRAALHLPPDDQVALVNFVHAQRRRFNIAEPCSPRYRPLQPGGEPLPGETPEEQDVAFAEQLIDLESFLVVDVVETLDDARAAYRQLVATNTRTLRTGLRLPRWTEDSFHGHEHATINDYLMGVGRAPLDPDAFYAVEDAYIAEPSDANFYALLDSFEARTHDLGYADAHEAANRKANGRCNAIQKQGGMLGFSDLKKKESAYIVQHLMRAALRGASSWEELPTAPFVGFGNTLNPFYRLGAQFAEFNCRNADDMMASWPDEPAAEIPQSDLDSGEAIELSRQLNHPWQSLGQLYDPALMMREGQTPNQLHYWALHGFTQRAVHLPFYYAHRVAQQIHFYEDLRGTPEHPGEGFFGGAEVHPVLDGRRLFLRPAGFRRANDDDETIRGAVSNTMRCNIVRMVLLMQRDLFSQGAGGNSILAREEGDSLNRHWNEWTTVANQMNDGKRPLFGPLAERRALCAEGLVSLIDEVRDLGAQAADL